MSDLFTTLLTICIAVKSLYGLNQSSRDEGILQKAKTDDGISHDGFMEWDNNWKKIDIDFSLKSELCHSTMDCYGTNSGDGFQESVSQLVPVKIQPNVEVRLNIDEAPPRTRFYLVEREDFLSCDSSRGIELLTTVHSAPSVSPPSVAPSAAKPYDWDPSVNLSASGTIHSLHGTSNLNSSDYNYSFSDLSYPGSSSSITAAPNLGTFKSNITGTYGTNFSDHIKSDHVGTSALDISGSATILPGSGTPDTFSAHTNTLPVIETEQDGSLKFNVRRGSSIAFSAEKLLPGISYYVIGLSAAHSYEVKSTEAVEVQTSVIKLSSSLPSVGGAPAETVKEERSRAASADVKLSSAADQATLSKEKIGDINSLRASTPVEKATETVHMPLSKALSSIATATEDPLEAALTQTTYQMTAANMLSEMATSILAQANYTEEQKKFRSQVDMEASPLRSAVSENIPTITDTTYAIPSRKAENVADLDVTNEKNEKETDRMPSAVLKNQVTEIGRMDESPKSEVNNFRLQEYISISQSRGIQKDARASCLAGLRINITVMMSECGSPFQDYGSDDDDIQIKNLKKANISSMCSSSKQRCVVGLHSSEITYRCLHCTAPIPGAAAANSTPVDTIPAHKSAVAEGTAEKLLQKSCNFAHCSHSNETSDNDFQSHHSDFGIIMPRQLLTCEVDACVTNPCNNGICLPQGSTYQCYCIPGYGGPHCEKLLYSIPQTGSSSACLLSPCRNGGTCHPDHSSNSPEVFPGILDETEGFRCDCTPGFTGLDCSIKTDFCSARPCPHACMDYGHYYICECNPGYTGKACEIDIDECDSNPCRSGAPCVDLVDGFQCICPPNFHGPHCELHTLEVSPEDAYIIGERGSEGLGRRPWHRPVHSMAAVALTLSGAIIIALTVIAACYCRVHGVCDSFLTARRGYQKHINEFRTSCSILSYLKGGARRLVRSGSRARAKARGGISYSSPIDIVTETTVQTPGRSREGPALEFSEIFLQ